MTARLAHLWRDHRTAVLAFMLVLGLFGFFGLRSASDMMYWADPAHNDQPLAAWMTPNYIAKSYDIPRDVVNDALMLDPDGPQRRLSVGRIAADLDVPVSDLQQRIDAATAAWRAVQP